MQIALGLLVLAVGLPIARNMDFGRPACPGDCVEVTQDPEDLKTITVKLPTEYRIRPALENFGARIGRDLEESDILKGPVAVARNAEGDLLVASMASNVVVKPTDQGIERVAGTGHAGFGENDGNATEIDLNAPADIATDKYGNVYIADRDNDAVRVVDTDGRIHTIAGKRDDEGNFVEGQPHISRPSQISVDEDGTVYVTESPSASTAPGEPPRMWALEPIENITNSGEPAKTSDETAERADSD